MVQRKENQEKRRETQAPRTQPEEGQTYHTAHRSQIGTAHEPPVRDLRQKGRNAE